MIIQDAQKEIYICILLHSLWIRVDFKEVKTVNIWKYWHFIQDIHKPNILEIRQPNTSQNDAIRWYKNKGKSGSLYAQTQADLVK